MGRLCVEVGRRQGRLRMCWQSRRDTGDQLAPWTEVVLTPVFSEPCPSFAQPLCMLVPSHRLHRLVCCSSGLGQDAARRESLR